MLWTIRDLESVRGLDWGPEQAVHAAYPYPKALLSSGHCDFGL